MVTAEMRNLILRDQMIEDLMCIKKEIEEIKLQLKALTNERQSPTIGHNWCATDCGVYCTICGED